MTSRQHAGAVGGSPASQAELLRGVLAPIAAAYPGGSDADLVDLHHAGNGFRVDRNDPRYPAALDALDRADAWGQVERGLAEALARQRSAIPHIRLVDDLHVVLLLGDPGDTFFVDVAGGYYGMGGIPGSLFLVVWPTGRSENRIGYCAVHEFHHNVRYTNLPWNPGALHAHRGDLGSGRPGDLTTTSFLFDHGSAVADVR